jgi:4-hydroxy-tetrahydrodipicolinate reductase
MRVAVAGALGKMGRTACGALASTPGLELVGGFDRHETGKTIAALLNLSQGGPMYDDIEALYDTERPDVVVDFTVYPMTLDVARAAVTRGISPVIGATGWTDEDEVSFADLCDTEDVPALIAPNFAIGAVLMMNFARQAAQYFPTVEIIELHHDKKIDKPSGTAKLTARLINEVRGSEVPPVEVHSVRLRGLVAHQEVLFGGTDELLTIRHDSLSRQSFMPGVVLAVQRVKQLEGLKIGLEHILESSAHASGVTTP